MHPGSVANPGAAAVPLPATRPRSFLETLHLIHHTCPFPPQVTHPSPPVHAAAAPPGGSLPSSEPSRPPTPARLFIPPSPQFPPPFITTTTQFTTPQRESSSSTAGAQSSDPKQRSKLSDRQTDRGREDRSLTTDDTHGDGRAQAREGRGGGAEPAPRVPVPPDGRRARGALPVPQGRRAAPPRAHHRRGRPLPLRPLGAPRPRPLRHPRVVLLHAPRPQVPQRVATQPRRRERVLEGHRGRQARRAARRAHHGDQEGAGVLCREGAERGEDGLDHARVQARRCRAGQRQRQEGIPQAGRLGAVPAVQQEERVGEDAAARRAEGGAQGGGGVCGVGHGDLAVPLALVGRGAHAGVGDRGHRPGAVPAAGGSRGVPEPRGGGGAPGDDGDADGAQEGGGGRGPERPVRGPQLRRHPEHVQRPRRDAARGRPALLVPLRVAQAPREPPRLRRRRHAGPLLS